MPIPVRDIKDIQIDLVWTDHYGNGKKTFRNVQELAAFLKDNSEFAKAVNYIDKTKK